MFGTIANSYSGTLVLMPRTNVVITGGQTVLALIIFTTLGPILLAIRKALQKSDFPKVYAYDSGWFNSTLEPFRFVTHARYLARKGYKMV